MLNHFNFSLMNILLCNQHHKTTLDMLFNHIEWNRRMFESYSIKDLVQCSKWIESRLLACVSKIFTTIWKRASYHIYLNQFSNSKYKKWFLNPIKIRLFHFMIYISYPNVKYHILQKQYWFTRKPFACHHPTI